MRIVFLCEAGFIDRALRLLRSGREDVAVSMEDVESSESSENADSDGPALEGLEAIEAGMEALYHIHDVMEEALEMNADFVLGT